MRAKLYSVISLNALTAHLSNLPALKLLIPSHSLWIRFIPLQRF